MRIGLHVDPIKIGEEEDETHEDGIAQAQQMEFELTKDVSLGYIPKYRLVNAYQKLMANRRLSPNSPSQCFRTYPGPNEVPIPMPSDRVTEIPVRVEGLPVAV